MINVNKEITKTKEEIKGWQPKFWGVRKDGKSVLVKYNQRIKDMDTGHYYYAKNTEMELYASKIFDFFGIPCSKVEKGIDKTANRKQRKCIVVENFLKDSERLIEINSPYDESIDFKKFIEDIVDSNLAQADLTNEERENIIRDIIRIAFVDCIVGHNDRFYGNIGIIYNDKSNSYRCAPAYDNARIFMSDTADNKDKMLQSIFKNYMPYVEDLIDKIADSTSKKNMNSFFGLFNGYLKQKLCFNVRHIINIYSRYMSASDKKNFKSELAFKSETLDRQSEKNSNLDKRQEENKER